MYKNILKISLAMRVRYTGLIENTVKIRVHADVLNTTPNLLLRTTLQQFARHVTITFGHCDISGECCL